MYGLINKALQAFLTENYGAALWSRVAHALGLGPEGFEAMLRYDDRLTEELIDTTSQPFAPLAFRLACMSAICFPYRHSCVFQQAPKARAPATIAVAA